MSKPTYYIKPPKTSEPDGFSATKVQFSGWVTHPSSEVSDLARAEVSSKCRRTRSTAPGTHYTESGRGTPGRDCSERTTRVRFWGLEWKQGFGSEEGSTCTLNPLLQSCLTAAGLSATRRSPEKSVLYYIGELGRAANSGAVCSGFLKGDYTVHPKGACKEFSNDGPWACKLEATQQQ